MVNGSSIHVPVHTMGGVGTEVKPLKEIMDEYEKGILLSCIQRNSGNVSAAARELGLTRQALQYKMRKYDF